MLAPRRGCLDYSKFYYDVTERWLLAWNQNKHITYIHSPPLRLMTPTSSLLDSSQYFADFHFGPCRGKFVDIPYDNRFGAIMDLHISNVADSRTFPFPRCLADSSCIVEAVQ